MILLEPLSVGLVESVLAGRLDPLMALHLAASDAAYVEHGCLRSGPPVQVGQLVLFHLDRLGHNGSVTPELFGEDNT